jgi:hypothetical protein
MVTSTNGRQAVLGISLSQRIGDVSCTICAVVVDNEDFGVDPQAFQALSQE